MSPARLAVVAALVVVLVCAHLLIARRRRGLVAHQPTLPRLPPELVAGPGPTWVVFTSPWCAGCGPVVQHLRQRDPGARVVTVDATREPDLAGAYSVRTAPTALLSDSTGEVRARLVGAEAVDDYVRSPA